MNRFAVGIGVDLIKNITELQIEFIFSHVSNMRRGQYVWMRGEDVLGVRHRLIVKDINGGMNAASCDFCFKSARCDKRGAGCINQETA